MATKGKSSGKTAKSRKGNEEIQSASTEWKQIARIAFGLFFAIASIYTLITIISYVFTWSADQSIIGNPVFDLGQKADNAGGKLGFRYGNLIVGKLFGFGAVAISALLGSVAVQLLKIHRVNLVKIFTICVLGTIIISTFAAFIASLFSRVELLGGEPGGHYGRMTVEWMTCAIGAFGTGAVIFLLTAVWLMLFSGKVADWFDRMIFNTAQKAEQVMIPVFSRESSKEEEKETEVEVEYENAVGDIPEIVPMESEPAFVEDVPETVETSPEPQDEYIPEIRDTDQVAVQPETAIEPQPEQEPADAEVTLDIAESDNDFMSNLTEEEKARIFDPRLDLPRYERPSLSMLYDYKNLWFEVPLTELEKNKQRIVNALGNYKIRISGITASKGPTVTLYKIRLAEGIKVAQVRSLEEDIAISLGTKGVRVVTLTDSVGIEVPNERASVVPLKSVLNSPQFKDANMELPLALGITVTNEPFFLDLGKMPHLLVAGATGMGKSVGLNCIIASLLYCKHPAEIKFVMVDPKKVELSLYSKLEKHFLAKLPDGDEAIITDTKKVICTLKSLCIEMEDRYELMKNADVRQIKEYNKLFLDRKLNPRDGHKYMPYIIVVIDEFADLISTAGREIEEPIARLAQKARAVGIHLVLATQRPTTDIITGTIKANFNARIAFKVNSMVDSKTIIDTPGANRLIGRGDMLVIAPNKDLTRVQCALIDKECSDIVKFIAAQAGYDKPYLLPEYEDESEDGGGEEVDLRKRDKLFEEAAKIIVQYQQGSTSLLQRKLNLGYNRAGRLIDQLEAAGIVGPFEGSKARQVLIADFDTLDKKLDALDRM